MPASAARARQRVRGPPRILAAAGIPHLHSGAPVAVAGVDAADNSLGGAAVAAVHNSLGVAAAAGSTDVAEAVAAQRVRGAHPAQHTAQRRRSTAGVAEAAGCGDRGASDAHEACGADSSFSVYVCTPSRLRGETNGAPRYRSLPSDN